MLNILIYVKMTRNKKGEPIFLVVVEYA